jgi:hypothetical protein
MKHQHIDHMVTQLLYALYVLTLRYPYRPMIATFNLAKC